MKGYFVDVVNRWVVLLGVVYIIAWIIFGNPWLFTSF
jgi:hypothetical protein